MCSCIRVNEIIVCLCIYYIKHSIVYRNRFIYIFNSAGQIRKNITHNPFIVYSANMSKYLTNHIWKNIDVSYNNVTDSGF